MRYRIYLVDQEAVEVDVWDLRVTGARRASAQCVSGQPWAVDLGFANPIRRIADEYDRTVYEK